GDALPGAAREAGADQQAGGGESGVHGRSVVGRVAKARRPGARVRRAVGDVLALYRLSEVGGRRRDRARSAAVSADRGAIGRRQADSGAEEPGGLAEAPGEVRRDSRVPVVGARAVGIDREYVSIAGGSDRHHAIADGARWTAR